MRNPVFPGDRDGFIEGGPFRKSRVSTKQTFDDYQDSMVLPVFFQLKSSANNR